MQLQGRPYQHEPIPARGPGSEALAEINPMMRVPALKLDDGTVLIETSAIVDWLEETAPPGKRLLPASGPERMRRLQGVALANTLAEKAVALSGEKVRRPANLHWAEEITRFEAQMAKALEIGDAHTPEAGFSGPDGQPDGAAVAMVTAFDFAAKVFPDLVAERYPRLTALSQRANALPAFGSTQP
jgi:glutathione S-transferase